MFEAQVQNARLFLEWCRLLLTRYNDLLPDLPDMQENISEVVTQLAEKAKQGARMKALGEASVEVAELE